jgi:phosphate transport system protein
MSRQAFEQQRQELKISLIELGKAVEQTIIDGMQALKTSDDAIAPALIAGNAEINRRRFEIEQQAYELIATQPPLAGDLPEILAVLLIAVELQRIADHSRNLAETVIPMKAQPALKPPMSILRLAELCEEMLIEALDAFRRNDLALGRSVAEHDDELDELNKQIFRQVMVLLMENHRTVGQVMNWLSVGHNLGRIADRITNIGERVIYAATGRPEAWNVEPPQSKRARV